MVLQDIDTPIKRLFGMVRMKGRINWKFIFNISWFHILNYLPVFEKPPKNVKYI